MGFLKDYNFAQDSNVWVGVKPYTVFCCHLPKVNNDLERLLWKGFFIITPESANVLVPYYDITALLVFSSWIILGSVCVGMSRSGCGDIISFHCKLSSIPGYDLKKLLDTSQLFIIKVKDMYFHNVFETEALRLSKNIKFILVVSATSFSKLFRVYTKCGGQLFPLAI